MTKNVPGWKPGGAFPGRGRGRVTGNNLGVRHARSPARSTGGRRRFGTALGLRLPASREANDPPSGPLAYPTWKRVRSSWFLWAGRSPGGRRLDAGQALDLGLDPGAFHQLLDDLLMRFHVEVLQPFHSSWGPDQVVRAPSSRTASVGQFIEASKWEVLVRCAPKAGRQHRRGRAPCPRGIAKPTVTHPDRQLPLKGHRFVATGQLVVDGALTGRWPPWGQAVGARGSRGELPEAICNTRHLP